MSFSDPLDCSDLPPADIKATWGFWVGVFAMAAAAVAVLWWLE